MTEEFICIQCGMETNEARCPRCKLDSCVEKKRLENCFGPDWHNRKKHKNNIESKVNEEDV